MMDCIAVPYSNYANLVSYVLLAEEALLVLEMLIQRYDEQGPEGCWFNCLSTQVSFLQQQFGAISLFVDSCRGSGFLIDDGVSPLADE